MSEKGFNSHSRGFTNVTGKKKILAWNYVSRIGIFYLMLLCSDNSLSKELYYFSMTLGLWTFWNSKLE